MSTQILLPEGYRYVAGALVSVVWLMGWQTIVVNRYRSSSGIKYPQLYAEKAEAQASREAHLFNCAQRAHQNTLEHMPAILITTPSLRRARVHSGHFTRVLYTIGYTSGDAAKRNSRGGFLGEIPSIGLILGSTYTAYQLFCGA
ncbi:hypothetical protein EV363DRAFT_1449808 [Boletus edulis]|nr:hypothetical protein EV363DRAFT_1449808 [Boletus edulis]